jgi:3alpha(or 20beta)-hydroxysteroid dehydrogenase
VGDSRRRFDGQVVLVTGGSSGMGAEHVRGFASEGARTVIVDILDEPGRALADELGTNVAFHHLDVTDADAWGLTIDEVERSHGPVSVLVNNAAVIPALPLEQTSPSEFRTTLDVNVTGYFLGIRAVAPSMRRHGSGSIVNISSSVGLTGWANYAAYSTSKWAIRGLTKAAALELARDGIRVNSVHPGVIASDKTRGLEFVENMVAGFPLARMGEPSEVTEMVMFLASQAASYSTGHEFVVDGGQVVGDPLR